MNEKKLLKKIKFFNNESLFTLCWFTATLFNELINYKAYHTDANQKEESFKKKRMHCFFKN